MSVLTEQTVRIVCGYLTYIDIVPLSYFWSSFFVGNAGSLTNGMEGVGGIGGHTPPLLFLKVRCHVGILEIRFCVILQNMSECQHCHMSILSESRRGPCISYLDFLINTDRSLFPQEDIRNDLHVIWFEAETRGILDEEGFRLITS